MEKIVRPGDLNMSKDYLSKSKYMRKKTCKEIVHKAFEKMENRLSTEQRASVMINILENSLKILEEEESYEEAQIILDIKNVIPEVFREMSGQQSSQSAESP